MTDITKGCAGKKSSSTVMLEEFVPSSGWSEDSDSHHLLLHLPGFKKEQVKLQVNNRGEIITSGERQTNGNKLVTRFLRTFKIPENSISEKITGKFQAEVLSVTVPKRKSIVKNLKEKQGIVITAVLAFSLGALAGHKLSRHGLIWSA